MNDKKGNITLKAVALLGFITEKQENPQQQTNKRNTIAASIGFGGLLLGIICAFFVFKKWGK